MVKIFHVPSHLTYVAKLASSEFVPVASPTGRPLQLSELVALVSWDFFDVLHLHTVELATANDLERTVLRAADEGKGLVFTAHDLAPNIETDRAAFDFKTALLARHAGAVITLTSTAAEQLARISEVALASVRVVPHGAALPLPLVGRNSGGTALASIGALRPNRDFLSVVRAWRHLPLSRPPLRLLLRSFTAADQQRYAAVLNQIEQDAQVETKLDITTTPDLMPPEDLAAWCRPVAALVLPYTTITHSGQLELARDLGICAVAPDVPTLRDQLGTGPRHPVVWFALADLNYPQRLAGHIRHALALRPAVTDSNAIRDYRAAEHAQVLDDHRDAYLSATYPE